MSLREMCIYVQLLPIHIKNKGGGWRDRYARKGINRRNKNLHTIYLSIRVPTSVAAAAAAELNKNKGMSRGLLLIYLATSPVSI
jgi:hypothetical protein